MINKVTVTNEIVAFHPGSILRRRFIEPLGLSLTDVAEAMNISVYSLSRIVDEKADLSCDMALRLNGVFGIGAVTWMNMQTAYSLKEAKKVFDESDVKQLWKSNTGIESEEV